MQNSMTVRTRIAPSPTGYLHFGTVRTALFNYLFARQQGGTFIMRVEDTDKERNREEYAADIHTQMHWLGLEPDETYLQSERLPQHQAAIVKMLEADTAYISKEPAKDDSGREVEVVRLRNPGKIITFTDLIRGEITFDTTELGDFVVARSVSDPLYHLAVVVDDHDMEITHVIRGEDHISNTPRQILIQEALGYPRPQYAHIPLILAADRSKMSKRKHETSIVQYRNRGFLAPALINYLALLGWNPGTDQEIFTLEELVPAFSLEQIQKGGAVFDIEKLRWYNRHYLLAMPEDEFSYEAREVLKDALAARDIPWHEEIAENLASLMKERTSVWEDLRTAVAAGEYDFFFTEPDVDPQQLPGKNTDAAGAKKHLAYVDELLASLTHDDYSAEVIKEALMPYAEEVGRGAVLWPLRYALSGRTQSPDPFTITAILGIAESRLRISRALATLEG